MAFQKTGYQDALEFDPASGIIKYGNYEFFADQVGVKSQGKFTLNDYKSYLSRNAATTNSQNMLYRSSTPAASMSDAELRKGFESYANGLAGGSVRSGESREDLINRVGYMAATTSVNPRDTGGASFSKVSKIDDNTYSIEKFSIPNNIEFINKLNAEAARLSTNAAAGQVTDASRPAPSNSRLGKPNYSRAATVLAGEQNPLGGASTVLGS